MITEPLSDAAREAAEAFAGRAALVLSRELSSAGLFIIEGHGIAWRVKSQSAIHAKLHRARSINDFIGIRVLATHAGMLEPILANLRGWETNVGLRRVTLEAYFGYRDESGFRSIHLDYSPVDSGVSELPAWMTIELQLTTWLQHLHGYLSHQLYYKTPPEGRALQPESLRALSERLEALDEAIVQILP